MLKVFKNITLILFTFFLLSGFSFAEKAQTEPYNLAFLDKLLDENSTEHKILEGVRQIITSTKGIDYKTEKTIGETLALEGFKRYGLPLEDQDLQEYVNLVGAAVARNSMRPSIPYHFVVVKNDLQNAFACPGGIIFLSSGLLKTIENEGQLACILAHEVAHVGHKHALQSIRRARFLQGLGSLTAASMKGKEGKQFEEMLGNLQTILFDRGLDKNMEFEADLSGMDIAYRTGYDPAGLIQVLESLQQIQDQARHQGSWFSTHPPLSMRLEKCRSKLTEFPDHNNLARLKKRFEQKTQGF